MSFRSVAIRLTLLCVIFYSIPAQAQGLRKIKNEAFKRGEQLTYRIHYGIFDAGKATISVENENKQIDGRNTYHIIGLGNSTGTFNFFFKVRDRYESFIDEDALCPMIFIRRVDEGGFKFSQDMVFDQQYHKVNSSGKEFTIPNYVQDMISAFYYARTFDYTNEKPGKIDSVVTFVDNEVWTLKIKFVRRDTLDCDIGKVSCMVFEPMVQKGRIFKHDDDLQVWISDDKNHIPVRAQASILVGSIKLDLESYTGLPNDMAIVK